jgi:hypothetical protein
VPDLSVPAVVDAREAGNQAWAAWERSGYPKLCPCCGSWTQPDGSPGPHLPNCAQRVLVTYDEATQRRRVEAAAEFGWDQIPEASYQASVWTCPESCARIRETDYGDLCGPCQAAEPIPSPA